jgi:dipeptidase E
MAMPPAAHRLRNVAAALSTAAPVALSTMAAAATVTAPVTRCVVACGRGRDICAPAIRDTIVQLAQRRCATTPPALLYLGTPAFEGADAFELQTEGFTAVGCTVTELRLTDLLQLPSAAEISEAIDSADIIAVSGGNTLFGVARWRQLGVDHLLRAAWQRGAIMVGGSAGAICWFDGGHSDSLSPTSVLNPKPTLTEAEKSSWDYVRVAGLGLVPALCCPHHDQVQSNGIPRATDFDQMLLRNPGEVGICMDNMAAFVMEGDSWRAVAGEEGAGVQRKVWHNGEIVATPMPCGEELKPMADLLMLPDFTHLH